MIANIFQERKMFHQTMFFYLKLYIQHPEECLFDSCWLWLTTNFLGIYFYFPVTWLVNFVKVPLVIQYVVVTLKSVEEILQSDPPKETSSSTFTWHYLLCCTLNRFQLFESVDEILWSDHSNETVLSVL